jgi:hypothetical protein
METLKVSRSTYNLLSKLVLRDRKFVKDVCLTCNDNETAFLVTDKDNNTIKIELIEKQ